MSVAYKGYTINSNVSTACVNGYASTINDKIIRHVQHPGTARRRRVYGVINSANNIPCTFTAAVCREHAKHKVIYNGHPKVLCRLTASHEYFQRRRYNIIMIRKYYAYCSIAWVHRGHQPYPDHPR